MSVIKKDKTGDLNVTEYNLSLKKEKQDPKEMARSVEAKQRIIKHDRFHLSQKPKVIARDPGIPKPVVKSRTEAGKLVGIDVICTCGEKIQVNFDFET
jgi:hypothetical protein